jgi:hypothetical protein
MVLFQATEIIGWWEDGFLVRSFRGEAVESDHSPFLFAPKFWQAGRSITTRVMISEVLFGDFLFQRESHKYPQSRMSSGWSAEPKMASHALLKTRMRADVSELI